MEGILHSHAYARSPLRSFGDPELEERLGHNDLSPKGKFDEIYLFSNLFYLMATYFLRTATVLISQIHFGI